MPLRAIDENGVEYLSEKLESKDKERKYKCPHCSVEMLLIIPLVNIIKHFRHKKVCRYQTEPESTEHLSMKQFIHSKYPGSILEHRLDDQIADVFILGDQPIAIECQCSRISHREFVDRTMKYTEKGIAVLWIFGSKNFSRLSPSILQKQANLWYYGRYYFAVENYSVSPVHLRSNVPLGDGTFCMSTKRNVGSILGPPISDFRLIVIENNGILLARFTDKKFWHSYNGASQ